MHAYSPEAIPIVGELCDLYPATYMEDGEIKRVILKTSRDDEAAVMKEAVLLSALRRDVEPRFLPYFPRLIEVVDDGEHSINVLEYLEGFYTLQQVKDRYPNGLDPKDMAWMFRRLLVALGAAHNTTILHGAVEENHVMIHPEQHGLVLIDWCYGYHGEEKFSADVNQAATLMLWLIEDKAPKEMINFLHAAQMDKTEPAWIMLRLFDEILELLWGKRKFRPFKMAS